MLTVILIVSTADARPTSNRFDQIPSQDTTPRRRAIESADIAKWKTIRSATLSRDGKWFAYILSPSEGDDELIIRSTTSGDEMRLPVGQYGGRFAFSANNQWLVYKIAPNRDAPERFTQGGEAGLNKIVVLELSTRTRVEIDSVQSFTLDGERSQTVLIEPYPTRSNDALTVRGSGRDIILYDLVATTTTRIPNVREFAFDASGRWLAWTADAGGQFEKALRVRDMQAGTDRVLDHGRAFYRGLKWADQSSDHLAVLKGVADTALADTLYSLLWYTDISRAAPSAGHFDLHRQSPSGRAGMTISSIRPLRWAEGKDAIFFGIRPVRPQPSATIIAPEDKVDLVLWHWNEPRLQSQQQRERTRDAAYAYLAVYHLGEQRFVRLADNSLRDVDIAPRDQWAVGWDERAYATDNSMTGRQHVDLYAVDIRTGARRLLTKRFLLVFGSPGRTKRYFLSPDGVHVLTWADSAYTVHNMANGGSHPLVPQGGPTFGNEPYDYSPHKAPIEPKAWSRDGAVVILSDGWDFWAVPVTGGTPVNLTVDGRRNGIVYGAVASGLTKFDGIGGLATIDLSAPWYVSARTQWGMQAGYVRINGRTPGAQRVLWDEASFSLATKARDGDVVAFRRGSAIEFPDYYLTNLAFANARRITEANPQQREVLWPSGVKLVDYTGPSGGRLQAALLLPANYQPGKRYPSITLIYERESFRRNHYSAPTEWGGGGGEGTGVDATLYASRGYVIIFPDISYVRDRPGTSALHSVVAAVRAAVAAGVVDSSRVGLAGHSWGGYQSAFIATQTRLFKAVVTGAAVTDLVSYYGGVHPGSGQMLTAQVESDQVRITTPYWVDSETYMRESPVFHVAKVTAPVLLVQNDQDDALDWRQGIEFYNAMRRAKKPIVMLQYVGQGHSTGGAGNVKDLSRRVREFFDHFLLGAQSPAWWTNGVPYSEMAQHLQERGQ